MTQLLSLADRQEPIEGYLSRQAKKDNELVKLKTKGVPFFAQKLKTDVEVGLTEKQAVANQISYGKNELTKRKLKTFMQFVCNALEDEMLRILIVAAIISIVVEGFYSQERSTFWMEGVAILCAVVVVVLVASTNDYQKQRQFQELNTISQLSNKYDVIREGKSKEVAKDEIVVGDILLLKSGLELPVDGIVVTAIDLIFDESSMSGESHETYKNTIERCIAQGFQNKENASPVVISGSKIMSGEGKMLVLVVGKQNSMGRLNQLMLSANVVKNQQGEEEEEETRTPLEEKLDALAAKIGYFGLTVGGSLFVILCTRLLIAEIIPNGWSADKYLGEIITYLILSVAVIVAAVPEGLPLAVTISLAFSVKQMLQENTLVRRLASCETMGSAHVICTDKTGTLTMNDMFVVQIWNGKSFVGKAIQAESIRSHSRKQEYLELVYHCIAHNSSAVLSPKPKGSPTEIALMRFANLIDPKKDLLEERNSLASKYFLRLPFNSDRKRITTGVVLNGKRYIFLTGASELVVSACQSMHDVRNQMNGVARLDKTAVLGEIQRMTLKGLRVIALAVKEITTVNSEESQEKDKLGICKIQKEGFTLLLLAGIQDLSRPETKGALNQCSQAGVVVIMVTGDNSVTARSIGDSLGITVAGDNSPGLCMEGPEFQKLMAKAKTPEDVFKVVKNLKILARSRPEHKYKLVQGIEKLNNVVAVTGDGTNDAPALMKADVGLAMGIAGTQIAKNAADILIMDDNFNSIVRALVWGRNIYDSVRKFLQFQLTVNVVACTISVLTASLIRQSVLTPVQMLWVNMIMDSFASLALATEAPNTEDLLNRQPVDRSEGLISKRMVKHVIGQSVFQISLLLFLIFEGHKFLPEYPDEFDAIIGQDRSAKYFNGGTTMVNGCFYPLFSGNSYEQIFKKYHVYSRHFTFVFNTFVLLQVVNFFNCRRIYDQLNVFSGIFKNYIFLIIIAITCFLQWIIVFLLPTFFKIYEYRGLTVQQWGFSLLFASFSLPLSTLLRLIPYGKDETTKGTEIGVEVNHIKFREEQRIEIHKD